MKSKLGLGYNWGYRTEPEPNACLGLIDGRCNWPKGRALGGTSVINFLLYQRGHRRDFDEWSELGNTGWSYADVLPYFIKSEQSHLPNADNSKYHGTEGYLSVEHAPYTTNLLKTFLKAGQELGYETNDPNEESMMGFSQVQATMCGGRRCSAAKSYLKPILKRPNLSISMRSWVTNILIDPETKVAYGVEFYKNKKRYRIRARREVLLAAGVIGSAQLLMLSGIGPAEHLQEMNISTIADLKVGYNLQDHTGVTGLVFPVNQSVTIVESSVQTPRNVLSYAISGTGPLTSPGGAEGIAFMKLENSTLGTNENYDPSLFANIIAVSYFLNPDSDYPDVEVVMGAGALSGDISGTLRKMIGIPDEFFYGTFRDLIGKHAFGMVPILMRPKSRGRLKLRSRNPFHWPILQPRYFKVKSDLEQMREGIKLVCSM